MLRLRTTIKHAWGRLTPQAPLLQQHVGLRSSQRGLSLFQQVPNTGKAAHSHGEYSSAEASRERSHEEIVASINRYRSSIDSKTQHGQQLARSVAASVEQDKHVKLQRYEIFIDKMQKLYKSEIRQVKRQRNRFQVQRNALMFSLTPLKEVLRAYNELTNRGFNSEATVETLVNISKVIRGRGFTGRVHGDYSLPELDQSVRMQKLVDDMKYGLRVDQFFSPTHLAQASQGLGDIGYKNTHLIPMIFEKLNSLLDERQLGARNEALELNYLDAVYGGAKNFVARHYVFKGFQNSEEFNGYLQILMDWEKDNASTAAGAQLSAQTNDQLSGQASDLLQALSETINAAVQVKELQRDYQASIDNLRQQYFLMSEATDKHSFLQENEYIKYDLLELQELLVKGGYIDPEEANSFLSNESFDSRMQRASDVFYDYVQNYAPELLSPQHNSFFEAVTKKSPASSGKETDYLKEDQNVINLKTLSQSLVGLAEQALSYRRDIQGKDYLNKFYEDYLMPEEKEIFDNGIISFKDRMRTPVVMMERGYLKAWQLFKEHSLRILPRLTQLVREDKDQLDGQLHALSALNAMRVEEPALRSEILSNISRLASTQKVSASTLAAGLRGLAESPTPIDDRVRQIASTLTAQLDTTQLGSFAEQIHTLWSLCALQQYESRALAQCLRYLNSLSFERMDNDLKFDEFQRLLDVHNALKFEMPKPLGYQITNKGLLEGLQGKDFYLKFRFVEPHTKYDPFKQRVVQALSKGLTNASIEHQLIQENELFQAQTLEADVLNADRYPYKPDIIMGYKGQKVGVFVLTETSSMRDTHVAEGVEKFRQRLLQAATPDLKIAALAVDQVVRYDIEGLNLELNKEFSFTDVLEKQVGGADQAKMDFSNLSQFGALLVSRANGFLESLSSDREVKKLDALIQRLYRVLQVKQQTELRFEPLQKAAGYDEVRFQLMKLSLLYDAISAESKAFADSIVTEAGSASNFKALLKQTLQTVPKASHLQNQKQDATDLGLDAGWLGTRLEVELPLSSSIPVTKSIVPELINQRFMWVDDYFHYSDWKAKQQEVFDNFNLLQMPLKEAEDKYFFESHQARRVPQGVFPYPNHKRKLMLPVANHSLTQDFLRNKHHDEYVLFEKEPFKMMVVNELKKAETLAPIDDDTSMITNLQNIKQGLKSDYTDKEILNTILLNLSFTDQLIEEHLKGKAEKTEVKYVPRDAEGYRRFVESTYQSKDREDPYTHFYLKEARGKEQMKQMLEDAKKVQREVEEESKDTEVLEAGKKRMEALTEKIENMLMQEEAVNEDLLNLSDALRTHVEVKYDLRTLVKSEFVYDVDPELVDGSISNEEYLDIQRRRSESKLIKSKIIYKLYHQHELSPQEKQYLKKWASDVRTGTERNLHNLRDSMVPKEHTKLAIKDVDAKTLYTLNSIARVSLERDRHGAYSLSDLVLELSHFLDEEVVNKVETEIYSEKLKKEWKLSKGFKVVESRNKEIGLVLNELEEVAWRSAGMLDETDFNHIKAMISVKRNKDYFDKQFYPQDMASFRSFFEAANIYDNRLGLLERWLVRKEDEVQSRVERPPDSLKKSDQEIHEEMEVPRRRARQSLAAKLLTADEFGNPIEKKEYNDLTSMELHSLTENLCLRLYLFNYSYPAFLPQVIQAVMEHPSLLKSDRDQLELYTKMFELDWRGDRAYVNRHQFMSSNPIYLEGSNLKSYGEVNEEFVKDKLQRACAPYVEVAAERLLAQA